jgi:CheY-like chemotaxis protein
MLEIESRPSQGTTVKLTIPLPLQEALRERRGQTHDGHPSAPNPADAYRETSGVINVLLADDHDMVRKGFCAIIESDHNYRIVGEAIDGCSAVELTRSLQPNVVLMDVNMPRMNGIEATRIIKQEKPETIVIALSVNNDQHIVTSMMEAGASAYLTKGGSLDELFRVMNSVLPRV